MAQKEKYTDDRLTDAVVRYAEVFPGKIKVSELVKWASENIPGLEGVKPHNFRSGRKVVNKRTGKTEVVTLKAFERIKTINRMRTGEAAVRANELFRASDPDVFLGLPRPEQRRQILEIREQYESLASVNRILGRDNSVLKAENMALKESIGKLQEMLMQIRERQDQLDRKQALMVGVLDMKNQTEVLCSIGIMDGGIDLEKHMESLRQDIEGAFSISRSIKPFGAVPVTEDGAEQDECDAGRQKTFSTIFGGLDI